MYSATRIDVTKRKPHHRLVVHAVVGTALSIATVAGHLILVLVVVFPGARSVVLELEVVFILALDDGRRRRTGSDHVGAGDLDVNVDVGGDRSGGNGVRSVLSDQPGGELVLHMVDGRSGEVREELQYEEDENTNGILAPSEKSTGNIFGRESRKEKGGRVLAILSCNRSNSRATIPTLLRETAGSWMYRSPARTRCRTPRSCRKAVTTLGFMGVQDRAAIVLQR